MQFPTTRELISGGEETTAAAAAAGALYTEIWFLTVDKYLKGSQSSPPTRLKKEIEK